MTRVNETVQDIHQAEEPMPASQMQRTVIVGYRHLPDGPAALAAIGRLVKGDLLEVRCEPENKADARAIAIYKGDQHLGYVPLSQELRAALYDLGATATAEVYLEAVMNGGEIAKRGLPKIKVSWTIPDAVTP